MKIRRITPLDLEQVYEVEVSSFKYPYSKLLLLSWIILHSDTSVVAIEDGRVVGYCLSALERKGNTVRGHILSIAVLPEYRGRGIGKRMMSEVERILKEKGAEYVYLEVEEDNLVARRLYESLGYKEAGKIERYYPWGANAVIMVKKL